MIAHLFRPQKTPSIRSLIIAPEEGHLPRPPRVVIAHLLLGAQALSRDLGVALGDLDPDESTPEAQRRDAGCAGTREWVKDDVALVGEITYEIEHEMERLGARMIAAA